MSKHRTYILLTVILTIFFLIGIFTFNYSIDPIRVESDVTTRSQKYNDLMKYRPDTIMLGGSRIQFLSTNDVKQYTRDTVYNISMTNMTLFEQLKYVEFAIKEFNIKNIIIGLNYYTFGENAKKYELDFDEDLLKKGITFQYIKDIVQSYLTTSMTIDAIKISLNKEKYEERKKFDKYGSRTMFMQNQIIGGRNWEVRSNKTLKSYKKTFNDFQLSTKKMNYYRKIVDLAKNNNITIHIFTTPIHSSLYKLALDSSSLSAMNRWKKDLALIHEYYDFMNINSITVNSDNYIDVSHIKQQYGSLIFGRIFKNKNIKIPDDFGIYINKDNFKNYLADCVFAW
jgi:hypothetical protein